MQPITVDTLINYKQYAIIPEQGVDMLDDNGYPVICMDTLNNKLKEERYIQEFANYVTFDGLNKKDAWMQTFDVHPDLMNDSMQTKMYRWVKKDVVQKWLKKSVSSLEVDWIDKRVNALNHLYNIGTDVETSDKMKIDALDKFLGHLNREEKKLSIDMNGATQVNIVQVVQDKLQQITQGAMIQPNGSIGYVDAELIGDKDD